MMILPQFGSHLFLPFMCVLKKGPNGQVNTVYRKMKRPYNVLEQEFPDIVIPDELTRKYREDVTKKVELLEATYTNDGKMYYCVMTMEGEHKLVKRNLKSFPWVIARYMKASGERYGRGPRIICIA